MRPIIVSGLPPVETDWAPLIVCVLIAFICLAAVAVIDARVHKLNRTNTRNEK